MLEVLYKQLWGLSKSPIKLQTYSKQPLGVLGSTEVTVGYEQQEVVLPLIVIKGEGSALFWTNWLGLNWASIHSVHTLNLDEVLSKHSKVFHTELGMFKGPDVSISVTLMQPCNTVKLVLPYAMRGAVETELNRLVKKGTLEPIEYSDRAAPIVAVWKRDQQSV